MGRWVVIDAAGSRGVLILDSLRDAPYSRPYKWCTDNVSGIILVSRKRNAKCRRSNYDCARRYLQGAVFVMKMAGREIPVRLDKAFSTGAGKKKSGTLIGNTINRLFRWEQGTIVGNLVNKTFG